MKQVFISIFIPLVGLCMLTIRIIILHIHVYEFAVMCLKFIPCDRDECSFKT